MKTTAFAAVLLVVVVGCGADSSRVEGRLTEFDGDLTSVRSFTIRTDAGVSLRFVPDPDATFHGGPLSHLREHLVSGRPVVVFYEEAGDRLVAVSVEDA